MRLLVARGKVLAEHRGIDGHRVRFISIVAMIGRRARLLRVMWLVLLRMVIGAHDNLLIIAAPGERDRLIGPGPQASCTTSAPTSASTSERARRVVESDLRVVRLLLG